MERRSTPETEPDLLTAEEFYLRYGEGHLELSRGRVVGLPMPTNPIHGKVDSHLHGRLWSFVTERGLGEVFLNAGFILGKKVVRGPDEAFVAAERLKTTPPPEKGYWELAPDLVAEIVSPEDKADEIAEKVGDYLEAGVKLVWVVYPRQRQVQVFRANRAQILGSDEFLEGEDVVPGFRIQISDLWR